MSSNNQIPQRFKANRNKRSHQSSEDAPDMKRIKHNDGQRLLKHLETGVMILQYKAKNAVGNYHVWAIEMKQHLAARYKNLARFTVSTPPKYWIPPEVVMPDIEEFSQENDPFKFKTKDYEDKVKLRNRLIQDMETDKFPCFNDILKHLSVESMEIIQADVNYINYCDNSDVVALWKLCAMTHQSGVSGGSKSERIRDAWKAYFALEQGPKEDLDSYKKRTDASIANMTTIDPTIFPFAKIQSIHFFKGLDSGRYGQIQSAAMQSSLIGDSDGFKDTLTESYSVALNTKVINSKGEFVAPEKEFGICANVTVNAMQSYLSKGDGSKGSSGKGSSKTNKGAKGKGKGGSSASDKHPTKAAVKAAEAVIAAASAAVPAKKEPRCTLCDQMGHWVQNCHLFDKAKKAVTVAAVNSDAPGAPRGPVARVVAVSIVIDINTTKVTSALTSCYHVMHDSGASHGVFHNRDLLKNIRRVAERAEIRGMGGSRR